MFIIYVAHTPTYTVNTQQEAFTLAQALERTYGPQAIQVLKHHPITR